MAKGIYVGGHPTLPAGYTQVEYIQSDYISYFDTGYAITEGTKIIADFQMVYKQWGAEFCVFGVYDDAVSCRACVSPWNSFAVWETNTSYSSQETEIFIRTTAISEPSSVWTKTGQTVYIFAQNENNKPHSQMGICKLYSLKIIEGGDVVKDYVPAVRSSDNRKGLYDLITRTFLEPKDVPSAYQRVQYIQSTGTQYIDTNYTANSNTGFYSVFSTTSTIGNSGSGAIFGAIGTSSNDNAYVLETWTNTTLKGNFKRVSTLADPGMIADTKITRNHSTVTNTLVNDDDGTYISINTDTLNGVVPLYVFASNSSNGVRTMSKTKMYLLIFTEYYKHIHFYVPVIRKADSKPGLYDMYTGTFLTNAGTGEFLYGNTVIDEMVAGSAVANNIAHGVTDIYVGTGNANSRNLPFAYTQMANIRSDMINYFDTGVPVTANMRIEAEYTLYYKQTGLEFALFGVRNDSGRIKAGLDVAGDYSTENTTYSPTTPELYVKTTVISYPASGYTSSNKTVFIFAQNQSDLPYSMCGICDLYWLKIYNGNTLIKDYVPAKRKSDGELGLYDVVNSAFLTKVQSIPSTYRHVAYLESTGTQYINTGYAPVNNTGFTAKFMTYNTNDDYGCVFGAQGSNITNNNYLVSTLNNGIFRRYNTNYDIALETSKILVRTHSCTTNTVTTGDYTFTSVNTTNNAYSTPIYLFAMNKNNTVYGAGKHRIYLLHLLENWMPKHIYVPVVRKSDDKPGMYDIIGQEFLTNAGTGEFIAGNDISDFEGGQIVYPNVARKVTAGYVGVSNVAHNFWKSGNWYTANGSIALSDILAAYKFKDASSDNEALTNLVNASAYKMNKYGNADRDSTGFLIDLATGKHLNNDSLRSAGIKSFVMKISSVTATNALPLSQLNSASGSPSVWLNTPFCTQSFAYKYSGNLGITHQNGLSEDYSNGSTTGTIPRNRVRIGGSNVDGVFGFSMDSANSGEVAYRNGVAQTLSNAKSGSYVWTGFISNSIPRIIGGYYDKNANGSNTDRWDYQGKVTAKGSFKVEYAAFYSIKLSAVQHSIIANLLNQM